MTSSLLGLLSNSFQRETLRLSWQAEIKADQQAASHGRSKEAARALLLIAAATEIPERTGLPTPPPRGRRHLPVLTTADAGLRSGGTTDISGGPERLSAPGVELARG